MSIPKELKRKVYNDWQKAFPELTAYNQNRFYKIAGPILFGLEIDKSSRSDIYRPYFEIYPLWKEDVSQCMKFPFLSFEILNKKNLQFRIPFDKHEQFFDDAVNCTLSFIEMPFEGNVLLKDIYKVIDDNAYTNNSFGIIHGYLLKLGMLFYLGCEEDVNKLLLEIKNDYNMRLKSLYFEHFFGPFDEWFAKLENSLSDRDKFLQTIEANKQDEKIKKLIVSDIVSDCNSRTRIQSRWQRVVDICKRWLSI